MIKESLQETELRMKGAISALEDDLGSIRTGRASTALVEKLPVTYYGTPTPLQASPKKRNWTWAEKS